MPVSPQLQNHTWCINKMQQVVFESQQNFLNILKDLLKSKAKVKI